MNEYISRVRLKEQQWATGYWTLDTGHTGHVGHAGHVEHWTLVTDHIGHWMQSTASPGATYRDNGLIVVGAGIVREAIVVFRISHGLATSSKP